MSFVTPTRRSQVIRNVENFLRNHKFMEEVEEHLIGAVFDEVDAVLPRYNLEAEETEAVASMFNDQIAWAAQMARDRVQGAMVTAIVDALEQATRCPCCKRGADNG